MISSLYFILIILVGEHLVKSYVSKSQLYQLNRPLWHILCRSVIVGVVFVVSLYQVTQLSFHAYILTILMCSLIYIAYIDIFVQKIPNAYIVILFSLWLVFIFSHLTYIWQSVGGFCIVLIMMLITHVISRGGIGAGDMKLLAVIGLYVGFFHIVPVLFWICSVLMLLSIGLLLIKKATFKTVLPMGPFIAIATILYIQQNIVLIMEG